MTRPFASIVLGLICVLLAGCNLGPFYGSAIMYQKGNDRPLGPDGREVAVKGYQRWDFVKRYGGVGWETSEGLVTPHGVVAEIEAFSPRPEPAILPGDYDGYKFARVYGDRRTIVCVDPVVVIVTPGEDLHPGSAQGWTEPGAAALYVKIAPLEVKLADGYIADTTIAVAPEAWWLSPSLGQPMTSIDLTAREPRIPLGVRDGIARTLILEDRRDAWIVRMERVRPTPAPGH